MTGQVIQISSHMQAGELMRALHRSGLEMHTDHKGGWCVEPQRPNTAKKMARIRFVTRRDGPEA